MPVRESTGETSHDVWALTAAEMATCTWLKPERIAQINFQEWTPDGHLRHSSSSFARMREDRDARKLVRE